MHSRWWQPLSTNEMSKPRRQHFIPKSYLKNFAIAEGDTFLVEGKLKSDNKPKDSLLSTKDICVDKNLYTIPNVSSDDKYALEKYYASEIDAVYPEVYDLLTNPKITSITIKQRIQIVMTTMSLFFRTPKFLNYNERRLDAIIDYAISNHQDKEGRIRLKFRDHEFDFHISEEDEIRQDLRVKNKLKFLRGHLDVWNKFTQFKVNAGLSVFRIYEDTDLITSDNPVIMHNYKANNFTDVFDPDNIISIPVDNKHFLTIFPNSEDSMTDRIFRGDRDKWFALTTNLQIEENAEDWILGKPNSIYKHIEDQKKYGDHSKENYQSLADMNEKAKDIEELSKLMGQANGFDATVADKIKELRQKRIHKNDPEMRKLIIELAKKGYLLNSLE